MRFQLKKEEYSQFNNFENLNIYNLYILSIIFSFNSDLEMKEHMVGKETKQGYKERWRSIRILYVTMFFDSLCKSNKY